VTRRILFNGEIWAGAGLSTVSAIHAPSCAATSDKLKRVSVTPQCGWLRRRCGLELPEGWAEQTAGYDQRARAAGAVWAVGAVICGTPIGEDRVAFPIRYTVARADDVR
jgi:hypothetical protein